MTDEAIKEAAFRITNARTLESKASTLESELLHVRKQADRERGIIDALKNGDAVAYKRLTGGPAAPGVFAFKPTTSGAV